MKQLGLDDSGFVKKPKKTRKQQYSTSCPAKQVLIEYTRGGLQRVGITD